MQARTFVIICLIPTFLGGWEDALRSDESKTSRSRIELDSVFNKKLHALADECETSDPNLAGTLRKLQVFRDPSRIYFFVPNPQGAFARQLTSTDKNSYLDRLTTLRKFYAKHLFEFAQQQLQDGNPFAAYRLLNEVCYHHPEHATASRVCDTLSRNRPVSTRPGRSVHTEFGWQPGRYRRLKSANYLVTTNAPQDSALELVRQLETLNHVWHQLFVTYWSNENQLKSAWNRKVRISKNRGRHEVVLFANRQGYIEFMQRLEPRARMTLGYYSIERETAYFFLQDENEGNFVSTWIHEATHQLFQEKKRLNRPMTFASDFWIIEGLALYLESLQDLGACYCTGGIEANRLQFARYRRLIDSYHVPIEKLVGFGRDRIQSHQDIRKLYSLAAGWTHFFMHAQGGSYRSALLDYVNQVYAGQSSPRTLTTLLRQPSVEIERQYGEFLGVDDQQLLNLDPRTRIENLALGNTAVSDNSVGRLALQHVRWLDLTHTKVTDAGLHHLDDARFLSQLALQGTGVTSRTINRLSGMRLLEELNIANTVVDDSAMATLNELPNLNLVLFEGSKISQKAIQNSRFAKQQ